MNVLVWIAGGVLVGLYGPRAVAWALRHERHYREQRTGPRVTIDDLLSDDFEERFPPRPVTRRDLRNRRH